VYSFLFFKKEETNRVFFEPIQEAWLRAAKVEKKVLPAGSGGFKSAEMFDVPPEKTFQS
jgi:hypothetical protein